MASRAVKRVAAAGAALVLALVAAEVGLRLAGVAEPRPRTWPGERTARAMEQFQLDPVIGWRMRADFVIAFATEGVVHDYVSDAQGRRFDPAAPPAASAKLLAVVGDSFAWGAGVDANETFGALLARGLGGWRLANWAMPGFGLDQIALAFETYALPERPALAIVAIFPADFERSLQAFREVEGLAKPSFRLEDGALVPRTEADRPGALAGWIDTHSRLWTVAKLASWRLAYRWPHGEWWELNRAFLERMIASARSAGVDVLFVHVPHRDWRSFPALGEFLRGVGADYLDPVALAPQAPEGLYFATDNHWNAAGQRWIAERILAWLREHRPALFQ